jgi:hypothetical protein
MYVYLTVPATVAVKLIVIDRPNGLLSNGDRPSGLLCNIAINNGEKGTSNQMRPGLISVWIQLLSANLAVGMQILATAKTQDRSRSLALMKNRLDLSHPTSLLQGFPKLELRSPYHLSDFQPFSLELMSYTNQIRTLALSFFIVGLLAISSTLSFEAWQLNPQATAENALLELTQGGFLLLAAVIQGLLAFNKHNSGLKRDIRLGLALFAFALFLREVDVNKLGNRDIWGAVENILRVSAVLMILGFVFHMSRRIKLVIANLNKILLAPTVILSLLACVLYACGLPFDRELFNIDKSLSKWLEETFELNACLLFLCASMVGNIKTVVVKIQAPSF